MPLLRLPQEILSQILGYLYPADIVNVGQTCRTARDFIIPANKVLWRAAFLQLFDDPKEAWHTSSQTHKSVLTKDIEDNWDWHARLKRRCLALRAVKPTARGEFAQGDFTAHDVIETLLEIIDTAKSKPTKSEIARGVVPQTDDRSSLNIKLLTPTHGPWSRLENLIHDSHDVGEEEVDNSHGTSLERRVTRSMSFSRQKASRSDAQSRLHTLYGRTAREKVEHKSKGYARRIVYNWSYPVPENDHGPFKTDGTGEINWPVLEALMSVITRNFELCVDGSMALPPGFCYSIPHRTLGDISAPEDWAGVTGSWVGTYSFLDYADLFHFNTWNEAALPPSLEDVPEACGDLMKLKLRLDPDLESDPKLGSPLPVSENLPTLYFSGDSISYDPFEHPRLLIGFKGRVSLCPGGHEVRWKYIISYRGQDQWQLEGVQPGGVRSGPVYGVWTQWGHEDHAPVGSFMYVPEELCKKQELVLSNNRGRDVLSQRDT